MTQRRPPLILLHALSVDAQVWNEIAPALAERYHVFALDQREHGEIEGAGHAVHQTRPEEYKDILRDFLFVLIAYLPQTRQYAHDAGTIKPIEE